jgi:ATP-dependent DNA helicase RecQ
VLQLAPAAAALLRGETELRVARPRVRVAAEKEAGAKRAKGGAKRGRAGARLLDVEAVTAQGSADDDALFEELRALRRQIAEREGVPAYVIFHDATLREMAVVRPSTLEELLDISGVGQRKLEKYGGEFLALLRPAGADEAAGNK